ncbi:MAG: hypothetical protein ABUS57_06865 [Pseudomonadota bacterium]
MRTLVSVLALSIAISGVAFAQPHQLTPQEQAAALQASQAQAQAQAVQPGDDQLTCDQLQAQMITQVNDPNVRSNINDAAGIAQHQQQQIAAAQQRQRQQAAPNMIAGMVSGFVPGGAAAATAAARAQADQDAANAKAHAAENQAQMSQMMGDMNAIMPQMARGQRLYQLAQAKQCAFLNGPPPGAPSSH